MNMIVHSSDFANSARKFETARTGTFRLFEEFFQQGDMEKEKHLPVSFLCDRETTKVAQSQPGFLGFVVLPLYRSMIEVIPQAKILVDQLEMNADEWKNYEETVKDRRVYIKPK